VEQTNKINSPLPSVADIIFIAIIYLAIFKLPNFMFADGSTGWHLVTGHYILDNFSIPHTDIISYTFPNKEWVAYEWLFDVIAAALDKIGGLKLLAVASVCFIATLFLNLYEDCRKTSCHFIFVLVLTIMGSLISAVHWLARPHLFTFWGVYIFSKLLSKFDQGLISNKKLLLFLSLTMIIWVNTHPAFLLGFAIILIYLITALFNWAINSDINIKALYKEKAKKLSLAFVCVFSASFLNPYFYKLYSYIFQYFQQKTVLEQTDEYMSPVFHGALQPTCLELLFFALLIGLLASTKRPSLGQFLTVAAFAHLALASVRNTACFVIVSLPVICALLAHINFKSLFNIDNEHMANWFKPINKWWHHIGSLFDKIESQCNMHILPIVLTIVLVISCFNDGKLFGVPIVSSGFDPKNKPTVTLDYVKDHKLAAEHGFTYDNWGGYIRYKTGMKVFIDDRADFYGQKFYLDYASPATLQPGWQKVLDNYKIDWILFPNNSTLAFRLKEEPNWKLVAQDQASMLFERIK
jgi:hypothetical protein